MTSSTEFSPAAAPARARKPVEPAEDALYSDVERIHPKAVKGTYRRIKTVLVLLLLGIYFVVPWLRWDRGIGAQSQAVLFDISGSRIYLFGLELWAQHIYYLTGILVFSAVTLLATTLAGRVWCGFACPQTVFVDLFVWVERWIEGDRAQRLRLARSPWTMDKLRKRVLVQVIWLLISVVTSITFIGYFTDLPALTLDVVTFNISSMEFWFIVLFASTTYSFAAYLREHLCIYMCPWPRFQGAMQDEDSLIVTYQGWRGEKRGPIRKSMSPETRRARGFGDCIDCNQCFQACPVGVDIREGQQMACIGCGLCIDACNIAMKRAGLPGELVTFDTQSNQDAKSIGSSHRYRLVRTRTVLYSLVLVLIAAVMVVTMAERPHLNVSVLRDRAPLYVRLAGDMIRNGYTFKVSNMTREPRDYRLTLEGIPGAVMSVAGGESAYAAEERLSAAPDSVTTYRVLVEAPAASLGGVSTPLNFVLTSLSDTESQTYKSTFMGPSR